MDAKLTLKLNQEVIEKVKDYAQRKQSSLSKLVETYFRFLIDQQESTTELEISPSIKELSGIIQLEDDENMRDDYTKYLRGCVKSLISVSI